MQLTIREIKKLFPDHNLTLDDEQVVVGINRDSRSIQKGEIYAAIRGERFDGHTFIDEAFQKGACAAIVDERKFEGDNIIVTGNVIHALGELAHYYREKFKQPVIAITGSNGKTTTKEFLAHVLSQDGNVISSQGNLNNNIGVPITVYTFTDDAQYFIVEMGMNHFEEIRYLTKIVQPDMALITSIGRSHLKGVGETIEGVARAKGELFEELTTDATAFVYHDDPNIQKMETKAKTVTFGFESQSDIWISDIMTVENGSAFKIHHGDKVLSARINMVGRHHVQNALSVYAIASELGLQDKKILKGLASYTINFNRGQKIEKENMIVVDDSYNANPDSMKASIQSLCDEYSELYKLAALGAMLEMGEQAPQLHYEVGQVCKDSGVDEVFGYGENAEQYLKGFGYNDKDVQTRHFDDHEKLAHAIDKSAQNSKVNSALLLKGSRAMAMEKVLEYLN